MHSGDPVWRCRPDDTGKNDGLFGWREACMTEAVSANHAKSRRTAAPQSPKPSQAQKNSP